MKLKKLMAVMTAFVVTAGSFVVPEKTVALPSLSVTAAAEDYTEGSFTYTVTDGKATVTKYNGTETDVTIPGTLGGYTVTAIGSNAFSSKSSLNSITIPDGVTEIASRAFYNCNALTSISLPDSLTTIGEYAFGFCNALTDITLPDGVTSIGEGAFYSCKSLTSIAIPDNVTSIGAWTFVDCSALKDITFSKNLESIGMRAFYWCESLESLSFPAALTSIGDSAFIDCDSITRIDVAEDNGSFASVDGVLFSKDKATLIMYPAGNTAASYAIPDGVTSIANSAFRQSHALTGITIPNSVQTIGESAFYYCNSLKDVTIPDSVTTIGEEAFECCDSLEQIVIPAGVTDIGEGIFASCSSLKNITVAAGNENYEVVDGVLFTKDKTKLIAYPATKTESTYDIPEGVTKIGGCAFSDCSSLKSVTIPAGVTSIGFSAFSDCTSLGSMTLPEGVTSIDSRAFGNCTSLESITIPDSVSYIAQQAFCYCRSLKSITIPEGVIYINENTFSYCISLTSVTLPDSVTEIGRYAFHGCASLESIKIPENVTRIRDYAFEQCTALASISIPESVTTIESGAFRSCGNLSHIHIAQGKTASDYMGAGDLPQDSALYFVINAYGNCSLGNDCPIASGYPVCDGFTYEVVDGTATILSYSGSAAELTVPEKLDGYTVTAIGASAFRENASLTSIILPDSVKSIGEYAFYRCRSLDKIKLPAALESIGKYAFYVSGITEIIIPDSVKSIGEYAFEYCSDLISLTLPNGITTIEAHTFEGCSDLKYLTLPDSVTTIGKNAFYNCSSIVSLVISANVTKVGTGAFDNCSSLANLTLFNSPESIEDNVFTGNYIAIHIPYGKTAEEYMGRGNLPQYPEYYFVLDENGYCTSDHTHYYGDYSYTVADGKATLFRYTGDEENVVIPKKFECYTVTALDSYAFCECYSTLKSVTIPDSVTSIGESAFSGCSYLESVTIPDSVTSLGDWAFSNCSALSNVTIPKSVTSIGASAFYDCTSLTSMTIPNGVTSIGEFAFEFCSSLESVTIPKSVNSIGEGAFALCENLTHIHIPNGTTAADYIGKGDLPEDESFYYVLKSDGSCPMGEDCPNKPPVVNIVPQNVKAAAGDGEVTLTWDAVDGATAYTVKSGKDSTILAKGLKTNTATITGLTNGEEYTFRVFAYVDGKWSGASEVVSATPVAAVKPVTNIPQNLKATVGDGKVVLTWDAVPGATAYTVKGGTDTTIYAKGIKTNTATVTGLTNGKEYTFRVFAYVDGKWSGASEVVSATPVAAVKPVTTTPQNLKATVGDGKVVLTWDAVPGATAYTVKGGSDTTIYAKGIKTNTATVTGLKNGTTYTFRVFAYVNGKWGAAAAIKATPVTTIPQNLKATVGDGKVVLTWDAVPGATAYTVKGGTDTTIYAKGIKTNTATVTGLKNGTTYTFRVFAYVNGKWGAAASIKATPVTTTPQNLKATVGNGKVTLTWDKVPGATAYTIKGGSDSTIYAKSIKTNGYTVSGLKNGTTYIFRVFAYVNGKWSAAAVVKATPNAVAS